MIPQMVMFAQKIKVMKIGALVKIMKIKQYVHGGLGDVSPLLQIRQEHHLKIE